MADTHTIKAFKCRYCHKEFEGRKKKYCCKKCRNKAREERRRGTDARIKPYKPRRQPNPIINGMRKCLDCGAVKAVNEYDKKVRNGKVYVSSICNPCTAEFSRQRKRKARAEGRTYRDLKNERIRRHEREGKCGPPTYEVWLEAVRPKAKLNEASMDARVRRNAREAFDYWIKVKAPDSWVAAYYKATGKPWSNPRLSESEQYRIRYRLDPEFNIKERLRNQLKKALKKQDSSAGHLLRESIKRDVKRSRTMEARLGYGVSELKDHLEKQFTKSMNWERFKSGEIHIDHIIPKSKFNTADEEEFRCCWCLSNLRPMWAQDNLSKGARIEGLL